MADWQAFEITVPGKDCLEPARNVLETLVTLLEVLKAILNTISQFLVDFGNPIKALVEALIQLIEELFASLKASGVFAYFDVPDFEADPELKRMRGGYDAWATRFKGSLYDTADYCRPQPRVSTKSGFVIFVVDAEDVRILVDRVMALLKFFGKELDSPRWAAPQNVQAIPVGSSGDPILALADMFSDPPEAIQVKWTLPTSSVVPDPGFLDTTTSILREFIPPSFLIERSEIPPTQTFDVSMNTGNTIDVEKMRSDSPDDTGAVVYDAISTFSVPGYPSSEVKYKKQLRDNNDEAVTKFSRYIDISGFNVTNILGQLGTFRYIDTEVEAGKTYYYRVRAYSGDLTMLPGDTMVAFEDLKTSTTNQDGNPGGGKYFKWPSSGDPVSMGTPSGIVTATIPDSGNYEGFDVLGSLKHLFQAAYSLDFHQEPEVGEGEVTDIGKGSLVDHAGLAASFQSAPILSALSTIGSAAAFGGTADTLSADQIAAAEEAGVDIVGGQSVELPWQKTIVRYQAARLADIVASAMLAQGGGPVGTYRNFMTENFPQTAISGYANLEEFVQAMTYVDDEGESTLDAQKIYEAAYSLAPPRENILYVVNFLRSFAFAGVPPNWVSVNLLRDIIPWSADIIDRLLAKLQALLDAFSGVISEINAFIDLLERKIQALEEFLQFLIGLLNFIESLEVSASMLSVSGITGGVDEWARLLDESGGARPLSDTTHLTAGVVLAYVAPDVSKFEKAFSIIF